MTAQIREKSTKLYPRDEVLKKISERDCLISVHEHMDNEELFFANGRSIFYGQDLTEFSASIPNRLFPNARLTPQFFAAVFFSCPAYERFRGIPIKSDVRDTTDIYYDINNRVFEEVGVLQKAFMSESQVTSENKLKVLPLPFLFVDPNQKATLFEKRYKSVLDKAMGLKWHPYAQNNAPGQYVSAGYVDLAGDYGLPTVIHTERPGEGGDLSALFRDVSPAAERAKANVDFAHMGFLHKDFEPFKDFEHTFVDICPWSAICLGEHKGISKDERANLLAGYLSIYGNKMLFGLDTPYHWSLWSSGETFGADIEEEFDIINQAISLTSPEQGRKLLYENPKKFLHPTNQGIGLG